PAERDRISLAHALGFGAPLYGFVIAEILYFSFWDSIWRQQLRMHDTYYGDPWYGGYYINNDGWDYEQASILDDYRSQHGASSSSGGDSGYGGDGGGSGDGGGWFSSIG